jgi:isopenicillin N synthase-like dioxygenase
MAEGVAWTVPVVNLAALVANGSPAEQQEVANHIGRACRDKGFFYIKGARARVRDKASGTRPALARAGHGVSEELIARLDRLSREFLALPLETKMKIRMELGGSAWRGFFPLGGELT